MKNEHATSFAGGSIALLLASACAVTLDDGGPDGDDDVAPDPDGGSQPPAPLPDAFPAPPDAAPVPDASDEFHADPEPGESPYYTTPSELCAYVNAARETSWGHDRYRGKPWAGEYHDVRTWPMHLAYSDALDDIAQAEADRLSGGGTPAGVIQGAGLPLVKAFWISGLNTSSYMITAHDTPGDWVSGSWKAALINSNGSARMALYYHDPGGAGPALDSVGCGGNTDGAGGEWWVIVVRD